MRLFAWETGLLFGKFNHMFAFADQTLEAAAHGRASSNNVQMAVGVLFGAQEAALDLRKICKSTTSHNANNEALVDHCERFPTASADAIRIALYRMGKQLDVKHLRDQAEEVAGWVSNCFDRVQALCESSGMSELATLEFAVVAAQAESPLRKPFGDVQSLVMKSGLPEPSWRKFVDCTEGGTLEELSREFNRLKLEVGHVLRHRKP